MVGANAFGVVLLLVQMVGSNEVARHANSVSEEARCTAYDFYLRGNAFFRSGDFDEAVVAFRNSVERDPGYCYARVNLGVALARTGKFDRAVAEFTRCIDGRFGSGADRFVFYFNRAVAYKAQGHAQSAQRDRNALEKLDPERAKEFRRSGNYVLIDSAYIERRNQAARDRFFLEFETSIARGKVVVRKVPGAGKSVEEYEALALIEGTLEEVSCVLADYARYPEFMPNVKEMIIADQPGGVTTVDWQLQLPMGFVKRYRLRCWVKYEENRVQRFWKKVPWFGLKPKQTIVDTYGQWILETFPGDDNRVLAYYRVYTDPGRVPFGTGWIVDHLTEQSVPQIIKRTRKRVKEIFR